MNGLLRYRSVNAARQSTMQQASTATGATQWDLYSGHSGKMSNLVRRIPSTEQEQVMRESRAPGSGQ